MNRTELTELLVEALQAWLAVRSDPELNEGEIRELATVLTNVLAQRTDLPLEPPGEGEGLPELPGDPS
jgi:hypothetical protein